MSKSTDKKGLPFLLNKKPKIFHLRGGDKGITTTSIEVTDWDIHLYFLYDYGFFVGFVSFWLLQHKNGVERWKDGMRTLVLRPWSAWKNGCIQAIYFMAYRSVAGRIQIQSMPYLNRHGVHY